MKKHHANKMLKTILKVVLAILLLIVIIPYIIPLSSEEQVLYPFENSYHFAIDETSIHYRVYEPNTELVLGKILLIHGLGGSTFSYDKNAPFLAQAGYLVITVDLPGFGYSSRYINQDHSQTARAAQLWQLLDKIDDNYSYNGSYPNSWHIGGHSMGGGTAVAMAYSRQDDVASVILIDGALFENNRSSTIATLPIISRIIQVLLEHVLIKPDRIESFLTSAYGQAPTDDQVLGYYTPLALNGTARSALALLKTANNIPEEQLTKLNLPVLAIWGENDSWVPIETTNKIKDLIPQTQIEVIEGAGHVPMETHEEAFNQILLQWLTNIFINY
ncbi:MAG: alpha/beta hydrolase [Erysipelotrichaceae bacterium]|nr:alpha/beta hydrolase [Erysipelotrichaceae bacterium]